MSENSVKVVALDGVLATLETVLNLTVVDMGQIIKDGPRKFEVPLVNAPGITAVITVDFVLGGGAVSAPAPVEAQE